MESEHATWCEECGEWECVHATDVYLNLVAQGQQPDAGALSRELVGWRDEALAAPVREIVGLPAALVAIRAGRRPWWKRWLHIR
ncbi:MAG: hypothetical protein LC749_14090 [Actinobacteria bacterium]|nr:hypothetical protein [Actinomycetota bacterium]